MFAFELQFGCLQQIRLLSLNYLQELIEVIDGPHFISQWQRRELRDVHVTLRGTLHVTRWSLNVQECKLSNTYITVLMYYNIIIL